VARLLAALDVADGAIHTRPPTRTPPMSSELLIL
jgi:hypothetical protein